MLELSRADRFNGAQTQVGTPVSGLATQYADRASDTILMRSDHTNTE